MFSFRQVLKQEPAGIVAALAQVLTLLVVTGAIDWAAETIVVAQGAALAVLTLFYIRPLTSSKDALNELEQASKKR